MNNKLRLLWFSNSPGPNQADFFDALYECPKIELSVLYCAGENYKWRGTDSNRHKHHSRVLFNLNPWPDTRQYLHLNPEAILTALFSNYDLYVVQGYLYPTALLSLLSLYIVNKPFVFWGEMIDRNPSMWKQMVKTIAVYPLFNRAEAILTMGDRGFESFRAIGIPQEKMFNLPYCCNLDSYLAVDPKQRLKKKGRKKLLVISQLIERKRVDIAIKSFLELAEKHKSWDMVIGGDGPLRAKLEAQVPTRYKSRVGFLGFVSKADQPEIYQSAHLFIITSKQDGWGVVVPEAMAAGLPVISTTAVESAKVILRNDEAGVLINPMDQDATTEALDLLMSNAMQRERISINARQIARNYDAKVVARGCAENLWEIYKRARKER